jgi:hypothetical protein
MTSIGAGTSTNARVFDNRLAGTELDRILEPMALLRRTYRHEERPCPACGKLYTGGQWIVPAVRPQFAGDLLSARPSAASLSGHCSRDLGLGLPR